MSMMMLITETRYDKVDHDSSLCSRDDRQTRGETKLLNGTSLTSSTIEESSACNFCRLCSSDGDCLARRQALQVHEQRHCPQLSQHARGHFHHQRQRRKQSMKASSSYFHKNRIDKSGGVRFWDDYYHYDWWVISAKRIFFMLWCRANLLRGCCVCAALFFMDFKDKKGTWICSGCLLGIVQRQASSTWSIACRQRRKWRNGGSD